MRIDILVHVIQEASSSDPRFGQKYLDHFGRIAERVMINTLARWPEERRPLARSKMACLFIMMDRIEFHQLCQDLDFRDFDPLSAVAKILWNELFGCAVPGSAGAVDA